MAGDIGVASIKRNACMRSPSPSITADDSALPLVNQLITKSRGRALMLEPSHDSAAVLSSLRITTRTPMGAIAYYSGGLLIDRGFVRVLGSGHPRLSRDLASWNASSAGFLLVADDASGGVFAINAGALGPDARNLYYWPAASLAWQPLEFGYTDFLFWLTSPDSIAFYRNLDVRHDAGRHNDTPGDHCRCEWPPRWLAGRLATPRDQRDMAIAEFLAIKLEATRKR